MVDPVRFNARRPRRLNETVFTERGLRLDTQAARRKARPVGWAIILLPLGVSVLVAIYWPQYTSAEQRSAFHLTPTNLATALIAINFAAFAAFGIDKGKAERGHWRIAESTLLTFALLGGTLGAYAGRALFRHKTRKQPFGSQLFAIAVLQMLALGGLLGWWLSG